MILFQMMQWLQDRLETGEDGASAVEYGMLVALIAAIVIGVVTTLGTDIQAAFQKVVNGI